MKKSKLLLLLTISAIAIGIITRLILDLTNSPALQFLPLILYAIALPAFFAKPLSKYFHQWSALFGVLTITWVVTMTVEFCSCYSFPPKGMLPGQWTTSDTAMLYSVVVGFAVVAALVTAGVIQAIARTRQQQVLSQ